jgi:CarD family transcriptional regulator
MKPRYRVGDKVVHPIYGAGTVIAIARKSIGGTENRYYVIEPLIHDMQIMIPVDRARDAGLRDVIKKSGISKVWRVLHGAPSQPLDDHKERQELVNEKLKSANPVKIAEVTRNLSWLERDRGRLGSKDTKLLDRARNLLAGELAVAEEMTFEDALAKIETALNPGGESQ